MKSCFHRHHPNPSCAPAQALSLAPASWALGTAVLAAPGCLGCSEPSPAPVLCHSLAALLQPSLPLALLATEQPLVAPSQPTLLHSAFIALDPKASDSSHDFYVLRIWMFYQAVTHLTPGTWKHISQTHFHFLATQGSSTLPKTP